jgi:putative transposase
MPSTHLSLHYHIIFSTKERRQLIRDEWRERLHEYLGGCVRTAGGVPEKIGGISDHVHLLIGLKATHCLADVIRDIKSNSSGWVKNELNAHLFSWQDGDGAFTVSRSMLGKVRVYIENQTEHHRRANFKDEYLGFLKLHEVEYDENHVW